MPPRTRRKPAPAVEREALTSVEEKIDSKPGDGVEEVADETSKPTQEVQVQTQAEEQAMSPAKPQTEQSKAWKRLLGAASDQAAKKPRITKTPSVQSAENNLKDSVRPGLILISIGLNPGIMTGKLGHAYAHPSNRYWPTLFASGITPILHKPEETFTLMDLYGIGHTNIIPDKATIGGNDLTKEDYMDGAKVLDEKIRELKPQAVMIVGKGIWEAWFQYKRGRKMTKNDRFDYGWQDEKLNVGGKNGVWDGAKTFVVTTTSGLSSQHTTEQRIAIWKPMGDWYAPKRQQWIMDREAKEPDGNKEPGAV